MLLLLLFSAAIFLRPAQSSPQVGSPRPNDHEDWHRPASLSNWDPETWTLSTDRFVPNTYQTQPYVANGYHGSRLTAEGIGYWKIRNETGSTQPINGWPLDNPRQTFATISGFWDSQRNTTRTNFPELLDRGRESVISGIPTWSSFVVTTESGKAYMPGVDKDEVKEYHQSLSLRNGVVETALSWCPDSCYKLRFTVVAHRERLNLGMLKVEIVPEKDGALVLTDVLDGQGAQRTEADQKRFEAEDDLIWTSLHPTGLPNVTTYEYSTLDLSGCGRDADLRNSRKEASERPWVSKNETTISQEFSIDAKAGRKIVVHKYVGIASTDAFTQASKTARAAALAAKKTGWDKLMREHSDAWQDLWDEGDIEIPNAGELTEFQISIRSSLYNLLTNLRSANEGPGLGDNSVSVGGLSSDSYAGLVFWDADLWMLPGLLVLHPEYAKAINNYRHKLLPQAERNAAEYNLSGAAYPWTSARFGNCTGTGPCVDYQYHLNTDIALVHWHQFLTDGDHDWLKKQGWPIIKGVTEMWADKVVTAPNDGEDGLKKGMYTVNNMTDPDEYANHIDNGAFTNVGVKRIMGIAREAAGIVGHKPPAKWKEIEEKIFIPYNNKAHITPEYATMNGSVEIKQADVVLINYPLEFRINESQANNDLDFYARAQSPDGPAMTWAMFAVNALDLSPHGCASWSYSLYASQPYLREPYYQFSEQIIDDIHENGNTNPAFTFLTGHGGFLQIPTHGYTGYRPRLDAFYLDPSLPPQFTTGIKIKGMKHQGAVFTVSIDLNKTTITRHRDRKAGHRSPVKVRIASRNPSAGEYTLLPGQSLVVGTRRPDRNGTDILGNLAECKPAVSRSPYVPGNFPVSAVDGSNHTNWRPATTGPADLAVDLMKEVSFGRIAVNWAKWPPLKFEVHASRDGKNWEEVYSEDDVEISDPWKEDEALIVKMTTGNQTNVDLDRKHKARWVRLRIEGDREGEGKAGGTVAQFALL